MFHSYSTPEGTLAQKSTSETHRSHKTSRKCLIWTKTSRFHHSMWFICVLQTISGVFKRVTYIFIMHRLYYCIDYYKIISFLPHSVTKSHIISQKEVISSVFVPFLSNSVILQGHDNCVVKNLSIKTQDHHLSSPKNEYSVIIYSAAHFLQRFVSRHWKVHPALDGCRISNLRVSPWWPIRRRLSALNVRRRGSEASETQSKEMPAPLPWKRSESPSLKSCLTFAAGFVVEGKPWVTLREVSCSAF